MYLPTPTGSKRSQSQAPGHAGCREQNTHDCTGFQLLQMGLQPPVLLIIGCMNIHKLLTYSEQFFPLCQPGMITPNSVIEEIKLQMWNV